ncbi:unnamed protein product [Soboliphyme baturini]|uniref:ESF1 protein n=1 Tax=Soboliphyme baturini TaxID=241478 RepID=A0A183J804_9BILA|nr:unnamed protein product [Soboliphyme baturini]
MKEIQDPRFSHVSWDPKFKRMPRKRKKVKIDKRFTSMFTDPKFKVEYELDKRGRPLYKSSTDDLKRFYDIDSSSEAESYASEKEDRLGECHVEVMLVSCFRLTMT